MNAEPGPLAQARECASQGEWQHAYELFLQADGLAPLAGVDIPIFARVAYATGHLDVTVTVWERAYLQSMKDGDRFSAGAAAVQIAMHLLLDTALMAPVRAWLRRADDLLEGTDDTPVHAWIAVVRNYERMLSGDIEAARLWARRAQDIGARFEPAAAAIGRVAEARAIILEGDVARGLELLDDAGVSILSGEIDPLATGIVFCEMVCSLQGLALYDLAEQWTEAMERWHQGLPVGSVHGRCRVHRAEILRLRGDYAGAEKEALLASKELRPYLRREMGWPLTELGRIRLRTGDVEGAQDAFLEAAALGWEPQPGLALVYLAQSKPALAASSIRSALDNPIGMPSKELPPNTDLRRAPLLEAQVEIELEAGVLDRAQMASDELSRIASRFGSQALLASAAYCAGRVGLAKGDTGSARSQLELAARLWNDIGAPYEAAVSRRWLGAAYQQEGREDAAYECWQSAHSAFRQLGAGLEATRTAEAIAGWTDITELLPARATESHLFRRDGEFWSVSFDGKTIHLRDAKGLQFLSRLLAEPGRHFHVLDLAAPVTPASSRDVAMRLERDSISQTSALDAGAVLDAQAKESYRRRLADIDEDVEDAERMGDTERATQARIERDFLVRELARAVGLGGRDRKAGALSERARVSVTRSIRQTMSRIEKEHPALGEHLGRAIRTGTYCAYLPDTRFQERWTV